MHADPILRGPWPGLATDWRWKSGRPPGRNTRAVLTVLINICAAPEWGRAYLAFGPCAANERANGYATKTRGAPAGSSRKSGRLPQRHLQALPLKLGCPGTPRTGALGFQFRGACWVGTRLGRRKRVASARPLARRAEAGPLRGRAARGTIGTAIGIGDAYGQRAALQRQNAGLSAPPLVLAMPTVNEHAAAINGKYLKRAPGGRVYATPPRRAPRVRSQQRRAAVQKICPAGGCALGVRGLPFVWAKPRTPVRVDKIKRTLMSIKI